MNEDNQKLYVENFQYIFTQLGNILYNKIRLFPFYHKLSSNTLLQYGGICISYFSRETVIPQKMKYMISIDSDDESDYREFKCQWIYKLEE